MREKHAQSYGFVSEKNFAQPDPRLAAHLIASFGNIATEEVQIDSDDLSGITMYSGHAGLSGISVHTTKTTRTVGLKNSMAIFFPVHGPHEVLSEIDIRSNSQFSSLAVVVSPNSSAKMLLASLRSHR